MSASLYPRWRRRENPGRLYVASGMRRSYLGGSEHRLEVEGVGKGLFQPGEGILREALRFQGLERYTGRSLQGFRAETEGDNLLYRRLRVTQGLESRGNG
jgi:hypothetical protein